MNVKVRLLGKLRNKLPAERLGPTSAAMTLPEGTTPARLIETLGLPAGVPYLVLVNDANVAPGEYASHALAEGDAITICPPIQGG